MSPRPTVPPIGLQLATTARAVSRAFDAALAAAGSSLPTWLILSSLKTRSTANQRELAAVVGIEGATLTHHLNAMETRGLLTRRRDPTNRRAHLVELTEQGDAAFHRLRDVALAHDRLLRAGLAQDELDLLRHVLAHMRSNITDRLEHSDEVNRSQPSGGISDRVRGPRRPPGKRASQSA